MKRFTDILEGTVIANLDLANGGYNYYGFVRTNGEWVIQRDLTNETESRYKSGSSGYSAGWAARTSQSYTLPIKA